VLGIIYQQKDIAGKLRRLNMESSFLMQFKDLGAVMVLALKKNFIQNKTASFLLVALTAAPLTQTIYGFIVMNRMLSLTLSGQYLWGVGLFSGAAIGLSAYWQGKCAAVACDAMGETGKGFGNYMVVLGMTETVALLVMVFTIVFLGRLAGG
jgi:V/A-type H+-transporting ATPase subunit K